ncbi:MAG: hypothetical protein ACQGVC_18185 [Myxococcota bacterium]
MTTDSDRKQLNEIARRCYEEAAGNWDRAVDLFLESLNPRSGLYSRLSRSLIAMQARDMIRGVAAGERSALVRDSPNPDAGLGFMERAVEKATRDLMDYPLGGGVRLRDATHSLLIEEASLREKFALANAIEGRFLRSVAKGVANDDTQRVSDVYSAEDLRRMHEKARE